MHEQDLEKIIDDLRQMEGRFESPVTAAAPHLNSTGIASFKRLMLEAKAILGVALGANDFSFPLVKMSNLPGYGMLNPPTLEQLHEAIALVEGGLNRVRRMNSQPRTQPGVIAKPEYVTAARVLQLRSIKSPQWDLKRLVRLLEELNTAHAHDLHMATAMLVRAVVDHVPPIFGAKNFSEVANNYTAPASFKHQMQQLDTSLRKIADSHLHLPVRKSEVLPVASQVEFRAALDVLLAEVIRLLQ
jgi:hypothetical protein